MAGLRGRIDRLEARIRGGGDKPRTLITVVYGPEFIAHKMG
jgi:hypothetical protein